MFDQEVSYIHMVYSAALWGLLIFSAEYLSQKHIKVRAVFEGKPSILVRNGKLDYHQLKKNKINMSQLQNLLRQKDVFSMREIEFAILEIDGTVSVLKKYQHQQPTKQDLNMLPVDVCLPVTLISDGQVLKDNLMACGFDLNWLRQQLAASCIDRYEDVAFAEWLDGEGLYIATYNIG